nr:sugar phosphate isomerase/epimerase [Halegenticoccus soli]
MDVGVLTAPLIDQPFEEAAEYLAGLGVDAVEPGVGGLHGGEHLDRETHLNDEGAQSAFRETLDEYDLYVSALATHNNPLHPDDEQAAEADRELREAIEVLQRSVFETTPGEAYWAE